MAAHILVRSALAFSTHSCLPCRDTNTLKCSHRNSAWRDVAPTKCRHAMMVESKDLDEAAQTLRRIGAAACTGFFLLSSSTAAPSFAQPGMAVPCVGTVRVGMGEVSTQGYVAFDLSELAPVSRDGKPGPIMLVPLLQAQRLLQEIQSEDFSQLKEADQVLSRGPFVPAKEMKRLFNLYSDNIYATDPSRKNMYLDGSAMLGLGPSTFGFGPLSVGQGGAVPENRETLTYLNEALDNFDALQAELKFVLKQVTEILVTFGVLQCKNGGSEEEIFIPSAEGNRQDRGLARPQGIHEDSQYSHRVQNGVRAISVQTRSHPHSSPVQNVIPLSPTEPAPRPAVGNGSIFFLSLLDLLLFLTGFFLTACDVIAVSSPALLHQCPPTFSCRGTCRLELNLSGGPSSQLDERERVRTGR
eukprot:757165-Hanusia_phi.AAC.3